jgi:hypothetical protein
VPLEDVEETALQVFAPTVDEDGADDDYAAVVDGAGADDGEQQALARLELVADDARDFAAHAKAANTLKAYRIDWADFSEWCAVHRLAFLPAEPQTVALYLTDLARTHKVSTLYRRLSGISQAHQAAGFPTPTTDAQVRLVFQGIRRTLGSAPTQKTRPWPAEVRAMVETLSPTSLIDIRDRALLLVGLPAPSAAVSSSPSTSPTWPSIATAWSCSCTDPRPIRSANRSPRQPGNTAAD